MSMPARGRRPLFEQVRMRRRWRDANAILAASVRDSNQSIEAARDRVDQIMLVRSTRNAAYQRALAEQQTASAYEQLEQSQSMHRSVQRTGAGSWAPASVEMPAGNEAELSLHLRPRSL